MSEGARILIVDDDLDMLHLIGLRLRAAGYQVVSADSGEAALEQFHKQRPQLVITDLRMGGMDGLTLFKHLQQSAPTLPVIILTAHGTIPDAVAATHRGVFSFLTKPFDGQELLRRTADAIRLSPTLDATSDQATWRKGLITANLVMEELLRQALHIATDSRPCLLLGPHGAGKTTLASAIHQASERRQRPFITFSCTDFPANEQEKRLTLTNPENHYAAATGGVLFIQDIGALSLMAQSRLFSVLFAQMQTRDPLFQLNGRALRQNIPDIQIIASSPRPLDSAVSEGNFRSDLFYLLSATTLRIPPLSERLDDISLLGAHFLARQSGNSLRTLAPEALAVLCEGHWPGNVRQLENVLRRVAELSLTQVVPAAIVRRVMHEGDEQHLAAFDDARRDFERDYLIRLLQTTAGNVSQAARVAQRNRTEFYKLLARHSLDPVNFKQKH